MGQGMTSDEVRTSEDGDFLRECTECTGKRVTKFFTYKLSQLWYRQFIRLLRSYRPHTGPIMDCQRIQMVLTIAFFSMLSLLASTRNLPESLTGTCTCTVNVSNQEVTYINDCTHRFEPSHEVLVMPLHPGTGSPRVKAHCICHCDLNLSGGSFY